MAVVDGFDRPWETVSSDGPLTRTVIDSALLLSVTAGPDPRDPLALPASSDDYLAAVLRSPTLRGKRIAFAPAPAGANVDKEVAAIVRDAVERIGREGQADIEEVALDVPDPVQYFEDFWSPGFVTQEGKVDSSSGPADSEVTAHPMMLELAELGRRISAVDYVHTATIVRGKITAAFNAVFAKHDLILTPTMPVTAFPHPGDIAGPASVNGCAVRRPAIDFHRFTESPSHAGLPAISIPCGFSAEGLPVGLQVIGPLYADAAILSCAAVIEQILPWSGRRPPI